jgi:sugar porter (SP) family MFS transporter
MHPRLFFWALASALAGFLFGFDTVVISGAEKTIQALWQLSPGMHGLALSAALWGTVLGSLVGGWQADRFGRKATLASIGVLFLIGALWSALAQDVYSFMLARFLGGIAIGVSTVASPLYIAEISPPEHRGFLTGMFQFNIVFGILIAFVSNHWLADFGAEPWRWMLGVMVVPSLVYVMACWTLPESPRWLLAHQGNRVAGLQVLRQLRPTASEAELAAVTEEWALATTSSRRVSSESFWRWNLRKPILVAFLVAFFNQLSGINAVLYFAPRIFGMTGLGAKAAMLQSVGIGVTNLIFTFVGLWLIDRMGRRTLLFLGSIGYILSLGTCAWAFFTAHYALVPVAIFAFIASHAIGQGAVIWVLISEVFPDRDRASGQALGSSTHWIFAALITAFFPMMVDKFEPGYVFLFFALMMCLQWVWVKWLVPETKGRSFEEIQQDLGAS